MLTPSPVGLAVVAWCGFGLVTRLAVAALSMTVAGAARVRRLLNHFHGCSR